MPAEFDTARAELIDHPLYTQITTEDRLRIFMKHHVPRGRADHGRFILEIVLAEETDEDGPENPAERARVRRPHPRRRHDGAPHEVPSSFCHGRENLLPDVFSAVRANVDEVPANAPVFRHYLDRHIALDHDEHVPLALRLLASLCDGDPVREAEARAVSVAAVRARIGLWDGVLAEFTDGR